MPLAVLQVGHRGLEGQGFAFSDGLSTVSLSSQSGSWWWPEVVAFPWGVPVMEVGGMWLSMGRSEGRVTNSYSLALPCGSSRAADREHAPRLKSAENANIQPNPGLILRAEPTVTNILKVSPLLHLCWAGWSQRQSLFPAAPVSTRPPGWLGGA